MKSTERNNINTFLSISEFRKQNSSILVKLEKGKMKTKKLKKIVEDNT